MPGSPATIQSLSTAGGYSRHEAVDDVERETVDVESDVGPHACNQSTHDSASGSEAAGPVSHGSWTAGGLLSVGSMPKSAVVEVGADL